MARFVIMLLLFALASPAAAQQVRSRMEITVERILLDLYVTDGRGEPIDDLRPSNFRVKIDGIPAEVEAVEFIDMTRPRVEDPEMVDPESDLAGLPPGRLLVFFFQTDFQRVSTRLGGHISMIQRAIEFLGTLQPRDRVAVVQFDSHLKIREDFTDDRERLERAIRESVRIDRPPPPRSVPSPSLMARLDLEQARRAASPEKALLLLGNALIPIPGPKSLVMFGWGLGRYGAGGVTMTPDYHPARRSLEKSRTAVFSLDVSQVDYHSLEVGLKKASEDTGGFYVKTHQFPSIAMSRLERTISARYELFVERPPELPRGLHRIEVELVGRRGAHVLVREMWEDPPRP
ncbi:MAG TPA: VWA domain-containing protein [Thermoanaerobaculia bacterium]|nr:VWA domain-containing protein [Thermoanaerobaculia bacterium]